MAWNDSYNTPNRFDESIDRCPQRGWNPVLLRLARRGLPRGTVINVLRVVGRAPPVRWPHSGLRVKGDRQFDGAGVPALRQPGWLAVVARISDAPRQHLQRLGHVAASDEMTEAMMHAAAKPEMRLALRRDIEARCEVLWVGS